MMYTYNNYCLKKAKWACKIRVLFTCTHEVLKMYQPLVTSFTNVISTLLAMCTCVNFFISSLTCMNVCCTSASVVYSSYSR